MPKVLPKKTPPPFPPDDPLVLGNPGWFADINAPTAEVPNMWEQMEPPPAPVPSPGFNVQVQSAPIPPHRRVVAREDLWFQGSWAPGSIGEQRQKRGEGPPPPFGSTLRKGAVRDISDPVVSAHLEWFVWPERAVTAEDIERMREEP
jgi:hypothetical protein